MRIELNITNGKELFILTLVNKYSFLIGYSGTGKSHLVSIIARPDPVFFKTDWEGNLYASGEGVESRGLIDAIQQDHGAIFIIDETSIHWNDVNFINYIVESKNYFLFIRRDTIPRLPRNIESIFEMVRIENRHEMVPLLMANGEQ